MKPLTQKDFEITSGGWFWNILAGATVYKIIVDGLNNLPDIREGFHDGYHGLEPRHQA